MNAKRFFFVLGMPRCRTAWLSVLLTGRDSFCYHEGHGKFGNWEDYVEAMHARPEPMVGDSSPGLCAYVDQLLASFPGASFFVIRRNPAEALEAFCAATPQDADEICRGWPAYLETFEAALLKLLPYAFAEFRDLYREDTCDLIHQHCLGFRMDSERWEQLQDFHIVSRFSAVQPKPKCEPLKVSVNVDGFDFFGLRVRSYQASDKEMISQWFAHHRDVPMPELRLPPLGVVIEDEEGPAAVLWCYETFGTGVAWIAVPVTRPGMTYARASTVLAFAIMAVTQLAGSGHEPVARFDCFRVICPSSMGRLLKRLGFIEQPDRRNFYLST